MQWNESGLVLGVRRHGDESVVLEVMTALRGRHLGLVRGGRSPRLAAVLQSGNTVDLTWRARLDEHLGIYTVEPVASRAAQLMRSAVSVYLVQILTAHLRLLPERDPHPGLHQAAESALAGFASVERVSALEAASFVARFEIALLEELGVGLDLSQCAATGGRVDLAFVSPKSGRAVSREGAAGYEDRLFPLPVFLSENTQSNIAPADIVDAFRLSGHFLARHAYGPRQVGEPESRSALLRLVERES